MLIALPAILLAAGCGAESAPPAATPPPSVSTTAAPTSTTEPIPTTTSTPPTTTSAPFAAADGRNLKACADGTCEVFVKTGDSLPNASGTGPVRIAVQDGMISISQESSSGMSSSLSGYPGMPEQINDQVFLIVAVQGDEGVLRLSK
jgi:hypothetical protein